VLLGAITQDAADALRTEDDHDDVVIEVTTGSRPGSAPYSTVTVSDADITYTLAKEKASFPRLPVAPIRLCCAGVLSPSTALADRVGMDIQLSCPHWGISVVNNSSGGQAEEVLYISATDTAVSVAESHTQRAIELHVGSFQIDQQCATGTDLGRDEDSIIVGPALEALASEKPLLHLSLSQSKTPAMYPVLVFSSPSW
jgi:hypothetical protein